VVDTTSRSLQESSEELLKGNSASAKARRLLCEILPERARRDFLMTGSFVHEGNGVTYRICERSQTQIYVNGRHSAIACLQLSVPAPGCDRMIAEYLILRNDERLYWNLANVLPLETRRLDYRLVLAAAFDLTLLVNLAWTVYRMMN
jgi:hypothetical protein